VKDKGNGGQNRGIMNLTQRLSNPDRRTTDIQPIAERRDGDERREPFVAPWRRRSMQQAEGRFLAVTDTTQAA
jgi:hypothetical protein